MTTTALILPQSRATRFFKYLVVPVSFLFLVATAALIPRGYPGAWSAVLFFTAQTAFALMYLAPNSSCLRLDPDGVTLRIFFLEQRFPWTETSAFRAEIVPRHFRFVLGRGGVFFEAERRSQFAQRIFGTKRAFAADYGMEPTELAALLNDWRERALRAALANEWRARGNAPVTPPAAS